MAKPDDIAYVYEPRPGEFVTGVPQRDLTHADVAALGPLAIEAARTGIYRKAKADEKAPKVYEPAPNEETEVNR
jgi:hypothetical protein